MKIFLDDERPAPEGWLRVYSVADVQFEIMSTKLNPTFVIEALSLDHDLGEGEPTGYDLLRWFEDMIIDDPSFPLPEISVHSANPVGRQNMMRALESIKRIRQAQLQEG